MQIPEQVGRRECCPFPDVVAWPPDQCGVSCAAGPVPRPSSYRTLRHLASADGKHPGGANINEMYYFCLQSGHKHGPLEVLTDLRLLYKDIFTPS